MSADVWTEPVAVLRPGLLADLEQPDAASLAALIGWEDVDGLAAALDGEPCGLDLVVTLVRHYVTLPYLYFARALDADGLTLATWARVHGFHSTSDAAVYLDLPRGSTADSPAPRCSSCSWPLDKHEPTWD